MWREVSVTDFVRNFAELINRVAYRGESLRLRRGNRVLAEVRPALESSRLADLAALLRGLPRLDSSDASAFAADLDRARQALDANAPGDPWAS